MLRFVCLALAVLALGLVAAPGARAESATARPGLALPPSPAPRIDFGGLAARPLDPTSATGIAHPTPAPRVGTSAFGVAQPACRTLRVLEPAGTRATIVRTAGAVPASYVATRTVDGRCEVSCGRCDPCDPCSPCCPPPSRQYQDPLSVSPLFWSSGYHDGSERACPTACDDPCRPTAPCVTPAPCDPCPPRVVVRRVVRPCYPAWTSCYTPCAPRYGWGYRYGCRPCGPWWPAVAVALTVPFWGCW